MMYFSRRGYYVIVTLLSECLLGEDRERRFVEEKVKDTGEGFIVLRSLGFIVA